MPRQSRPPRPRWPAAVQKASSAATTRKSIKHVTTVKPLLPCPFARNCHVGRGSRDVRRLRRGPLPEMIRLGDRIGPFNRPDLTPSCRRTTRRAHIFHLSTLLDRPRWQASRPSGPLAPRTGFRPLKHHQPRSMTPHQRCRMGNLTAPWSPSVAVAAAAVALLLPVTGCLGWGWTLAHDLIHHHHVFKPISVERGDPHAGPIDDPRPDVGRSSESVENP